jgi:outer membrane lipoprotein-sorting protein
MVGRYNARTGRKLAIAALVACLPAVPAPAQNIPLPNPRPAAIAQAATGSTAPSPAPSPAPSLAPKPAASTVPSPSPITNPFAALLGKPAVSNNTAFNKDQRTIIDKVDKYLSGTQRLSGNFVQVGPNGGRTQGEFFISKPGKVRFDYNPPSPIDIIADGQSVVVRDRNLATQDVYPLSQTPLRFLLSNRVDLIKDTNLVAVYADDVFITVVVEEKSAIVGTSRLMIMFSAKDTQLKQWTVTDPQGYDTTVAVYNLDTTKTPDPSMFKIDFTKYHN